MPRPVSIYAYFLPRIFLEALSGSEACMPVAPIQRSGLNCHCPLAGSILMALLRCKKNATFCPRHAVPQDGWSEAIPVNAGACGDGYRCAPPILVWGCGSQEAGMAANSS